MREGAGETRPSALIVALKAAMREAVSIRQSLGEQVVVSIRQSLA